MNFSVNETQIININETNGTDKATNYMMMAMEATDYVYLILFMIVQPLGIFGNILTIVIMQSEKFKGIVSRYYLTSLAVSDSIVLLTQQFNKKSLVKLIGYNVKAISETGCKTFFWFFRTGKMTSSWFMVSLCFERFLAVWLPTRTKTILTQKTALIQVIAIYGILGLFNALYTQHVRIKDGKTCNKQYFDKDDPHSRTQLNALTTASSVVYLVIPLTLMVVLTSLILYKIAQVHSARKRLSTSTNSKKPSNNKVTFMLLAIVLAYFVFATPTTILHNVEFHQRMNDGAMRSNAFHIFEETAHLCEQINYAINFYLYILASSHFRGRLVELFKKVFPWKKDNANQATQPSKTTEETNETSLQ